MSLSFASGFIRSVCNVLDSNRNSSQVFTRIFMNSETIEIFQSALAGKHARGEPIRWAQGKPCCSFRFRVCSTTAPGGPRRDPMCLGSSRAWCQACQTCIEHYATTVALALASSQSVCSRQCEDTQACQSRHHAAAGYLAMLLLPALGQRRSHPKRA